MFIPTRGGTVLGDAQNYCTNQNHLTREQALSIPEYMHLDFRRQSGVFLGRSPYGVRDSYVGIQAGEDFLGVVVGGPGSCKTTGIAIPTLATWSGSIIALDIKPKGKMLDSWNFFSWHKHGGKHLLVFNPLKPESWGYNPLLILETDEPKNKVRNAREIALSLLPTVADDRDKIWRRTAQQYLAAVIQYGFDLGMSFTTIMVALQTEPVSKMLELIMQSDNTLAKMQATQTSSTDAKVINNIGMDISELSVFATDPDIMSVLSSEKTNIIDWRWFNQSKNPIDIAIQIPEELLEQWSPLTTLMFNQLTRMLELREEKTESKLPPLLVMVDEFGKIGSVPSILSGLTTLRSRGVSFLLFVQYLSQLDIYGRNALNAFMGCATHKIILNVGDATEREYISKMIGDVETYDWCKTAGCNSQGFVSSYSQQLSTARKPIIFPEELGTLNEVIIHHRTGTTRAQKVPCFTQDFSQYFQNVNLIQPPPLPTHVGGWLY